mgnify:CR=1 FL=1
MVQASCLALFVWLFLAAAFKLSGLSDAALGSFFYSDPLIALGTWASSRAVGGLLLFACATIVATLALGRVFCGWICPLGTIHAAASVWRRAKPMVLARTESWSKRQRVKYYLLAAFMGMALFGGHWFGLFDPLSLLYRTLTASLGPGVQHAIKAGTTAVFQADPHVGPVRLAAVTEPIYRFSRDRVFGEGQQSYEGGFFILALFAAIVLLNLFRKRFWCRYICPLGALLGLLAKRPLLQRICAKDRCTNCALCRLDCQGGAIPDRATQWMPSECFMCMNCGAACDAQAIRFAFASPFKPQPGPKLDLGKRAMLTAGAAGVAGMIGMRLPPLARGDLFHPALIRPPGALAEPAFLARCIQCGLCMKVCPTNGLQPTLFEAGLEGLWTPRLAPKIGECEYECNRCGQACPTHAIEPLPLEKKKEVRIGLAAFDVSRCLPYAYGRECLVCEEHCPTPKKAIYFIEVDVPLRGGGTRRLKQPRVDTDLCIGCGACERKCVFVDVAAIRVTSANETRHPKNQPMLAGSQELLPPWNSPQDASGGASLSDPYANPY